MKLAVIKRCQYFIWFYDRNDDGCFMAGQNKDAPVDHVGNKIEKMIYIFMKDVRVNAV